jgi:hypothetical protein
MGLGSLHVPGFLSDDGHQLAFEMNEFTIRRIDDGIAGSDDSGAWLHEAHGNVRDLPVGFVDVCGIVVGEPEDPRPFEWRENDHVTDFVDLPRGGHPGKGIAFTSHDPGVTVFEFSVVTHTVDGIPDDPHAKPPQLGSRGRLQGPFR